MRSSSPTLRTLSGGLAAVDLVLLALLLARHPIVRPLVGPEDDDLATWTAGVVGTYTLAQAAIARRPSPEAARQLALLRAVLVGGDLTTAWRGRRVGRFGVATAVGNAALAWLAWRTAGDAGTPPDTPARSLPTSTGDGVE
jgi:hypothetical protein